MKYIYIYIYIHVCMPAVIFNLVNIWVLLSMNIRAVIECVCSFALPAQVGKWQATRQLLTRLLASGAIHESRLPADTVYSLSAAVELSTIWRRGSLSIQSLCLAGQTTASVETETWWPTLCVVWLLNKWHVEMYHSVLLWHAARFKKM